MTNQTIVAGTVGVFAGGLAGLLLGEALKRKLGPSAPELFTILAAGAGGVLAAALVTPAAPTSSQTSSAQGTVPVFVPGA